MVISEETHLFFYFFYQIFNSPQVKPGKTPSLGADLDDWRRITGLLFECN